MNKAQFRKQILEQRKALALSHPQAATRAASFLPEEVLVPSGIVGACIPMGSEIDPGPTLAHFEKKLWQVAMPHPDHKTPVFMDDGGQEVVPDLVLAPLLGYDDTGTRLGRGGGWYDRAIRAARDHKHCPMIGLAFAGQKLDRIPREDHDVPLDGLLTETGFRWF